MKKTKPIGIHLLGGAALLIGALTASADVVYTNYNLTHLRTEIYNDRIGNSRFFNGPNTDSIRVSTFLRPSPDSNVIGRPCKTQPAPINTGFALFPRQLHPPRINSPAIDF